MKVANGKAVESTKQSDILTLLKTEAKCIKTEPEIKQKEIADRIIHLQRLLRMQDGGVYMQNYDHLREVQKLTGKVKGFTYKETQLLAENNYRWFLKYETLIKFRYAAAFHSDDRCAAGTDYHKVIYKGDVPDFILDRIDQLEQLASSHPDIFIGLWGFVVLSMQPLPNEERELKPIDPIMVGFMNSHERNSFIGCKRDDPQKKLHVWVDENHKKEESTALVVGIWDGEKEIEIF